MDDAKQTELIAEFVAFTSAPSSVAEHYLAAHNWDLNASVEYFLDDPPDLNTFQHQQELDAEEPLLPTPNNNPEDVIDLAAETEDAELQKAMAESLRDSASHKTSAEEEGAAQIAALARQREDARAAARRREVSRENADRREMATESAPVPSSRSLPALSGVSIFPNFSGRPGARQPAVRFPAGMTPTVVTAPPPGYPMPTSGYPSWHTPAQPVPSSAIASDPFGTYGYDMDMEIPEGVVDPRELEEARMLEAAMMGTPYTGRIPRQQSAGTMGNTSEVVEVRREQDEAYEESLKADRAKAQAAAEERAAAAAAAAQSAQAEKESREQAVLEKRRHEEREAAVSRIVATKEATLPPEPEAGDPESIAIMVRMPDGSRVSRRFWRIERLSTLFDFVDVALKGSIVPGTYKLVNAYPRKVIEANGEATTLLEAGFDRDQALLLEGGEPGKGLPK